MAGAEHRIFGGHHKARETVEDQKKGGSYHGSSPLFIHPPTFSLIPLGLALDWFLFLAGQSACNSQQEDLVMLALFFAANTLRCNMGTKQKQATHPLKAQAE